MASSDFPPNFYLSPEDEWVNTDPPDYIFNSPSTSHQHLQSNWGIEDASTQQSYSQYLKPKVEPQNGPSQTSQRQEQGDQNLPHLSVPPEPASIPTSTSASSSRSSSNDSPSYNPPHHPQSSRVTTNVAGHAHNTEAYVKQENAFPMSKFEQFKGGDNDFSMDNEMDSLSLAPASGGFGCDTSSPSLDFPTSLFSARRNEGWSPPPLATLNHNASLDQAAQLTVQPNKTFTVGPGSREDSPNDGGMFASNESSPFAMTGNSPLSQNIDAMDSMLSDEGNTPRNHFSQATMHIEGVAEPGSVPSTGPTSALPQKVPGERWPCRLEVEAAPDKSRVETQIPVKLTLHNPPAGIKRLHLQTYTISKPKFQHRPTWQKSSDTLEVTCVLFCASALQKEGVLERAFRRGESEEVPVRKDEPHAASKELDENDPRRALNGGPVAICSGCVIRERKRAARKKTKKPDEEAEWQNEEAKRVVVFNCPEVRHWVVPGSKETTVEEHRHDGPLDKVFVHAPMRIACYCRHQGEKVGFQVLFTLRTADGEIVAQQISPSIMITDDHKQPVPQGGMPGAMTFTHGPAMSGMFAAAGHFGMIPTFQQNVPFRPSWSTNDLRLLNPLHPQLQYGPHNQDIRPMGSTQASEATTASTTPRNLSRPPSPTNPSGQPGAKKRRSGGVGRGLSSGLAMTSLDTAKSSSNHNIGSGPPSAGFSFTSPTSGSFGAAMDQSMQMNHMRNATSFPSGPPTPGGPGQYGLSAQSEDPHQYFSAPTSQHTSRAPSPTSASVFSIRQPPVTSAGPQLPPQTSHAAGAANALNELPSGLSIQNPPVIQRLIPSTGHRRGGTDVTVLGSGFYQGLEVMFGDVKAASTTFWGDTTLVCRAPPSPVAGAVSVVFQHQHHTGPSALKQIPRLMPFRIQSFYYTNDEPAYGGQPTRVGGFPGPTSNPASPTGSSGLQQQASAMDFFPGGATGYASANFARAAAVSGPGAGAGDGVMAAGITAGPPRIRHVPQRQLSGDHTLRMRAA